MNPDKRIIIDDLTARVNASPFLIVVDYTSITVPEFTNLRSALAACGARAASREELAAALERCRILLAAALAGLYGAVLEVSDRQAVENLMKNLTKSQMIGTIEILEKYRGECAYNVGTGHVLGALAVELEGIL